MELSDVTVFVKVVQSGSFTQAAKFLRAPKSTVSAKVANLERRLGISLLKRTTRKLHLTPEGETLFHTYAHALSEIETAESLASSGQTTPHGKLAVTAPANMGRFLPRFLKEYLGRYPKVNVDLLLTNRYVDLIGEGVDIAIRAGDLKDSSLMAKRIGMSQHALFASPEYLRLNGTPKHPNELAKHQCIRFSSSRGDEWRLMHGDEVVRVRVTGRVTVDDLIATKDLIIHDHGIALIPSFVCREDLAARRIVTVLPEWFTESVPISIVYPGHKFQQPKVRLFVDEVALALQNFYDALAY